MKHLLKIFSLLLFCALAQSAQADFTFAAFGDTPYTEDEESRFVSMIAEINREQPVFSIHVGDFKSGGSPCTDALFTQRRDWFTLFHQPLIYTPGDNEWTDCHRAWGTGYEPLERLQKLRSLFFSDNYSLGQRKITLTRQNTSYPEHARWEHEDIVFATLNVPGGNNNVRMPDELAARGKQTEAWVASTFALARAQSSSAVVLAMQANPLSQGSRIGRNYASLMNTITSESMNFKGEVLLIHGDTHYYRMDQPFVNPLTNDTVVNLTRLEVFGYPSVNWVRVRVTKRDGKVIFSSSPGG